MAHCRTGTRLAYISKHNIWMLILRSDLVLPFPLLQRVFDVSDQRVYQSPSFPHLLSGSFIDWAQVPFKYILKGDVNKSRCFFMHAFWFKYLKQVNLLIIGEIFPAGNLICFILFVWCLLQTCKLQTQYLWLLLNESYSVCIVCLCISVKNEFFVLICIISSLFNQINKYLTYWTISGLTL